MDSRHVLFYDRPARAWEEALPLGNGRIGAMVFGGVREERIALNEDTLWSGDGPKEWDNPTAREALPKAREALFGRRFTEVDGLVKQMQGPFTESYLPFGDLRLRFELVGEVTDYRRSLDLDRGIAETTFRAGGADYRREAFVSHPAQVAVVHLQSSVPGMLSF